MSGVHLHKTPLKITTYIGLGIREMIGDIVVFVLFAETWQESVVVISPPPPALHSIETILRLPQLRVVISNTSSINQPNQITDTVVIYM